MKKVVIFFGIVLIAVAGCQDHQEKNDVEVVLYKQHFEEGTETPINEEREYFRESGELYKKVVFVDGYPETVIYYHPNQQEKSKVVIADEGKGEVAHQTGWDENGQKKFEFTQGYIKEWHENGQRKSEAHYDENGDLHGVAKAWDEEGTLKDQEKYEHGTLTDSAGQ